jgi:hypothetical protein
VVKVGEIYEAWSDQGWVVDGAAVRVSLICFANKTIAKKYGRRLDDVPVSEILSNLSSDLDLSQAAALNENIERSFLGVKKGGPFDID